MNVKLLYVLSPCVLLFLLSCGWLTGPDDDIDPRKFTWTIDTLTVENNFQTHMRRIWGSSTNDVYVVGHNADGRGKMFHYDGQEWSAVGLHSVEGGPIDGIFTVNDIYGFGPDDIWAVGEHRYRNDNPPPNYHHSSLVIHYDGTGWWESDTINDVSLRTLGGGTGPDDFWVGGLNGITYHYDGAGFTRDTVPIAIVPEHSPQIADIVSGENLPTYALMAIPVDPSGSRYYILEYRDNAWQAIDSNYSATWGHLWLSPEGNLFATGTNRLDRWENGVRTTLLDTIHLRGIYGTAEDDYYIAGKDTPYTFNVAVWHYNGQEFRRLNTPDAGEVLVADIWTDGYEVFILGYVELEDSYASIVIHGR